MKSTIYNGLQSSYPINLLYTSVAPLLLQSTFIPLFNIISQVYSILIIEDQICRYYFVHLVLEYFDKMLFDLLSLFLQCIINDTFKNTDKELPWQKIKIYKFFLYYRFCQQNSMNISLSTCSEFGLQVYF